MFSRNLSRFSELFCDILDCDGKVSGLVNKLNGGCGHYYSWSYLLGQEAVHRPALAPIRLDQARSETKRAFGWLLATARQTFFF
jgi:hypothetical protein